jgi:hypothetical protein
MTGHRTIRVWHAFAGVLAALGASACLAAEGRFHYDCHVTGTEQLARLRPEDRAREMSHFTCRISGGLLDGFIATGTNILESQPGGAKLVASIVVARKEESLLAYEVSEGTRRLKKIKDRVVGWESTGTGVYRSAIGSVAPLAGRSFKAVVNSGVPGLFTIDVVVSGLGSPPKIQSRR